MFNITFENDHGKIQIGGGGHPFLRCREITGLGPPKKEYNTVKYVGEDGQHTISVKNSARTITISGDLIGGQYEISNLSKILYFEGDLLLQFGNKKRKIHCRCTDLNDPVRTGPYNQVVMQFVCDDPDFMDFTPFSVSLFRREDLISSPFTFTTGSGLVFTRRLNGADIINNGDLKTYPVFYVSNMPSADTFSLFADGVGILIQNITTGQKIELNYDARIGEEIVIDVENRSIEGNYNGVTTNLINYISTDTYLNKFWLEPGKNEISITNFNADNSITVACKYSNRYIEAVY